MRKLIIKYFALNGIYNFLNIFSFICLRCSLINYPLFVIASIFGLLKYEMYNVDFMLILSIILLAISFFISFVYLPKYNVKWEELDDYQKFQYSLNKELDISQFQELIDIKKRLKNKYPKYEWQ